MYYIKGYNPSNSSYLIVDTEDLSEEQHTREELNYYASLGANIAGFEPTTLMCHFPSNEELMKFASKLFITEVLKEVKQKKFTKDTDLYEFVIEAYANRLFRVSFHLGYNVAEEMVLEGVKSILDTGYKGLRQVTVVMSLSYYVQIRCNCNIDYFRGIVAQDFKKRGITVYILNDKTILLVGRDNSPY